MKTTRRDRSDQRQRKFYEERQRRAERSKDPAEVLAVAHDRLRATAQRLPMGEKDRLLTEAARLLVQLTETALTRADHRSHHTPDHTG